MGMIIVEDKTHKRLTKYKKKPLLKNLHPTGKISHSMIIDAGLDALDAEEKRIKHVGTVM